MNTPSSSGSGSIDASIARPIPKRHNFKAVAAVWCVHGLKHEMLVSIVSRFNTWFCCDGKFSGHVVFVVSGNTAF